MQSVTVVHKKLGASRLGPPDGGFEFTWELSMKFDWALSRLLEAKLTMTGVTFVTGIAEERRKEVQRVIQNFHCD
jgi:hypothetical protein